MTHEREVAYISGAITHDRNYMQKFADAEMVLQHIGYVVLNPTILPAGLNYTDYMLIDLKMVEVADAIIMLPDWMKSDGATIEHDHAVKLGKRIIAYHGIKTESPMAVKKQWKKYLESR